ncbi:hypothetical protein KEM48_000620 [Puccinia striiformis f. sp. tritici PST-130]|nr:hypothetical protein KEM48_000620 [Puccinia striiformis f. sp. tritici PST-130]
MQAHALTPLLTSDQPIRFPFLSLLVSGGHTMLVLVNSTNEFKILANTADKPIGLVISGGVGSNLILRSRIKTLLETIDPKLQLYIPPVELCTDNAAMVAWLGLDKLNRGVLAGMDDPVLAKWSIEDAEEEGHHQNIPTTIS